MLFLPNVFSLILKTFSFDALFTVAATVAIVTMKLITRDLGMSAPIREWFHISATAANRGTSTLPLRARYTIIRFIVPATIQLKTARRTANDPRVLAISDITYYELRIFQLV